MQLRILQLNVNGLNWQDNLASYLKTMSFDILNFQEIVGKDTTAGNISCSFDNVEALQKMLGPHYRPYLAKNNEITSSPTAYFGIATFINTALPVISHENIYLYKRNTPYPSDSQKFDEMTRSILALQIATDTTPLWLLQTHFTWSPTPEDTSRKLDAGKKLIEFVSSLKKPFVFTGDMNVDNNSAIIKNLEKYARNLLKEHNVTNTLNPRLHSATHLFPKGLAVDYIFTSPTIRVENFAVLDEDLSDHFALTATIEV